MCEAHCLSCVGKQCVLTKGQICFVMLNKQIFFTLVSEMEPCLLKGGKGMGLLEDECDLTDVADSVDLDLGDALLACK